jgi:predicted amidohydrolase YtcJ
VLIRGAELEGHGGLDVRVHGDRIAAIGAGLDRDPGEPVLEARGAALLPGLHDHHLHLFALAAAGTSLRCGPPQVRDRAQLVAALREAARGAPPGWLRGIGYHESVAGPPARELLDALLPDRPLRVQHRSGALWALNSAGIAALGLDAGIDAPGVERDPAGRATGRLYRLDGWLRERLDSRAFPALDAVSERLARCGVTGVTDATATNARCEWGALSAAVERRELRQRLLVMGSPELPESAQPRLRRGPLKLLLDERELPAPESLQDAIAAAHRTGRTVALHCTTRAELVVATAALGAAGARAGDRLEHASVAPPDLVEQIAQLGLTVVTQPGFLYERGDAYAREVEPRDQPWLYRARGFLEAGVPLGAGTDAPFGEPDPWQAMRAAVERRSAAGLELAPPERLTPEQALALFTTPADDPGGRPRRLQPGGPADLCLLDRPWARARRVLVRECVRATLCAGELVWCRDDWRVE